MCNVKCVNVFISERCCCLPGFWQQATHRSTLCVWLASLRLLTFAKFIQCSAVRSWRPASAAIWEHSLTDSTKCFCHVPSLLALLLPLLLMSNALQDMLLVKRFVFTAKASEEGEEKAKMQHNFFVADLSTLSLSRSLSSPCQNPHRQAEPGVSGVLCGHKPGADLQDSAVHALRPAPFESGGHL